MPEQLALVPAGPRLEFRRRPVPEARLELALRLLEAFNEAMGTRLAPLRRSGKPSESLSRILGALSDADPPLTEAEGLAAIQAAAAAPWWDGSPGTGVVFSPRALPAARERAAGRGRQRARPQTTSELLRALAG